MILRRSFLKDSGQTGYEEAADFNGDGTINTSDFMILRKNFLKEGAAKPTAGTSGTSALQSSGTSGMEPMTSANSPAVSNTASEGAAGGGCNSGFAGLLLLAVVPVLFKRKK